MEKGQHEQRVQARPYDVSRFYPLFQEIPGSGARLERGMSFLQKNPRFFASTRGRIVTLLRRNSRTVEELAQELTLTDNAVRAHLATLERDGIVQQRGVRRGSGKPSYIYDLTPEAEYLFPKA